MSAEMCLASPPLISPACCAALTRSITAPYAWRTSPPSGLSSRLACARFAVVALTTGGLHISLVGGNSSDTLTPADAADLADAFTFALRYQGRRRVHNADEIMAEIVAKRLVEHLERAGFVVMQRAPFGRGAALGRGFEG